MMILKNSVSTMQLAIVFLVSLFVASLLNDGVYRWAWNRRQIGPWSTAHPDAPPRRWSDYLPVIGWFGLEREAAIHGRWFWIRPMLIELLFAMGMCLLYQFEIDGGLHPGQKFDAALVREIRLEFFSHAILISLMLVATFIDLDEQTIPDQITVTGTIAGLVLATIWPASLLPDGAQTLWLTAPNDWLPALHRQQGLAVGLAAVAGWCLALPHRTIYFRRGVVKGVQFLFASMWRARETPWSIALWLFSSLYVLAVWRWWGADHWQGLLTSLVGLAAGGALVWAIRVAASVALQKEALGFGDVTLMAMIGSFLGWQPSILVFFMAPFAGAVIAVFQLLVTRRHDIAYGPYLCLAALFALVIWPSLWSRWWFAFGLGWILPAILLSCIVLMAIMLVGWRRLTETTQK
jgi:prepilin signal peptidase PulO-like enzyme (type II secretory pathway)